MHGGTSTGPRTPEGLERSRKANWKTGEYSAEAKADRQVLHAAFWVLGHTGVFKGKRPGRPPSLKSLAMLACFERTPNRC